MEVIAVNLLGSLSISATLGIILSLDFSSSDFLVALNGIKGVLWPIESSSNFWVSVWNSELASGVVSKGGVGRIDFEVLC